MPQSKREKAIQASYNRKFKIGDSVFYRARKDGYNGSNYLASGIITEINNPFVSVKINDVGRKVTGMLGIEAKPEKFIKITESNKHDSFREIKSRRYGKNNILKFGYNTYSLINESDL